MSEEHIRKTDSATAVKFVKSLNQNYYDKLESIVNTILQLKSEVADRSSLGSMAEVRDIHMTVQATDDDVQAIRQVLQEHQIGAEGQARQIAEQNAQNYELRQENAAYQRRITELSNGKPWDVASVVLLAANARL